MFFLKADRIKQHILEKAFSEEIDMVTSYKYEKTAFVSKTRTDALSAAFAGGGWLHLNKRANFE